jgi:16S rRNA (cytosine1402-N4)-methyltransferase
MRMDKRGLVTAGQIVNRASEAELVRIFKEYGEERQARRIAEAIVNKRRVTELRTTTELAELVQAVKGPRRTRIHAATKVFQALRMEVNQELSGLEELLNDVILLLRTGGRLVTISFQSGEDRICKRTLRLAAGKCICFRPADLCTCPKKKRVRILTPKPVTPSEQECRENPRSRSAKLRAAERIKEST